MIGFHSATTWHRISSAFWPSLRSPSFATRDRKSLGRAKKGGRIRSHRKNGLLSPALSSRGGEGEGRRSRSHGLSPLPLSPWDGERGKGNAGAEMMKRPLARSALSLGNDADL